VYAQDGIPQTLNPGFWIMRLAKMIKKPHNTWNTRRKHTENLGFNDTSG
jgi:hypothetical protein